MDSATRGSQLQTRDSYSSRGDASPLLGKEGVGGLAYVETASTAYRASQA
jgi:hypothetical protein